MEKDPELGPYFVGLGGMPNHNGILEVGWQSRRIPQLRAIPLSVTESSPWHPHTTHPSRQYCDGTSGCINLIKQADYDAVQLDWHGIWLAVIRDRVRVKTLPIPGSPQNTLAFAGLMRFLTL